MKYVNEKTLLSMTSVNKKYYKEEYFKEKCKDLPFQNSYRATFSKYKEFIRYMRSKKYKIEPWANPKNSFLQPDVLYRCSQYEKDARFHIMWMKNTKKCIGCRNCQSYYVEIAHDFLSYLVRNGYDDKVGIYFHLEYLNLMNHRDGKLCSKILSDSCQERKMFKISEKVLQSFCI
jgi:hypothetical protein